MWKGSCSKIRNRHEKSISNQLGSPLSYYKMKEFCHSKRIGKKFHITINVTNAGELDGYDVIQLYLKGKGSSITRRVKELKGFKKVWLSAGETKEVTFELGTEELQVFGSQNTYQLEQGWFGIEVGNPVTSLGADLNIG